MGGERLQVADLGWHGLDGDRRLAFRRLDDRSGFPWLSASRLPELIRFAPHPRGGAAAGDLPTHVRTPEGEELPVFSRELAAEVGRRFRPNILIASSRAVPFEEDDWVGGVLTFGDAAEAAALWVTHRDERCSMVNYDPESSRSAAEVLMVIARSRDNKAGVYGAVTRQGRLAAGRPVFFEPGRRPQAGS